MPDSTRPPRPTRPPHPPPPVEPDADDVARTQHEINFDFSTGDGLANSQFATLRKDIRQMSENLQTSVASLNAEVADLRTTVELIAPALQGLKDSLDAANAANADLQAQIATLTADAAVSQGTIDSLNAAATSAATAIDEATTSVDSLDDSLEGVSGETPPA